MVERRVERGWVPNLVAGVSVWGLADDLNAPPLFDGRLLEPDVDGPDTLPTAVEWDLTGLMPLADARARHPVKVALAVDAFLTCLRRAEAWLDDDGARFADAFTLPPLTSEHYFYSPRSGRLFVKNWGATPHRAAGAEVHVLGPRALLEAEAEAPIAEPTRRWPLAVAAALGLAGLLVALVWILFPAWSPVAATPSTPVVADPPAAPSVSESPPPPLPQPSHQIFFAVDEPTLAPSEYATLELVRAYLVDHPDVTRVRIEGHTDGRGEADHNAELGADRAERVRGWLIERGVDASRLEAVSCADRVPAATNATEQGRQANRRVELFVVDPPSDRRPHAGCAP